MWRWIAVFICLMGMSIGRSAEADLLWDPVGLGSGPVGDADDHEAPVALGRSPAEALGDPIRLLAGPLASERLLRGHRLDRQFVPKVSQEVLDEVELRV